jgi:predicted RNA-binding Zn ribbon-like protein
MRNTETVVDFHHYNSHFDLESEVLCLNLCNTLNWHASQNPTEELNTYADLVAWGFEASVLSADEANRLIRLGNEQPELAQAALADAITLREALYRVFVAIILGDEANKNDLSILTEFWHAASKQLSLASHAGEIIWKYEANHDDQRRMLWPVVHSAVELLQSDQRHRIGQCEDDRGCGYLFLDTSRNQSRRWCSMESCGNRAKANRHYTRLKK